MFGTKFKDLRVAQNISLKEAAARVINPSSLSRWENGQTELKFETVIELLENIHISPLEFLSITVLTPHTPLIDEIDRAINSSLELKKIAIRYLNFYKQQPNVDNLLNAAVACSFYFEVSNKDIFPKEYKNILEETFSNTFYWSRYYTLAFGSSLALLSTKTIYSFTVSFVNNIEKYKEAGYENFIDTFDVILNGYQKLIEKDVEKALQLKPKLQSIHLSFFSMYTNTRRQFLNALLLYRTTSNSAPITSIFNSLKILQQEDLLTEFNREFHLIKSLK